MTYNDLRKDGIKDLHNIDLIIRAKEDNEVLQDLLLANKDFIFSIIITFKGNIEDIKKRFGVDEEELLQHAYIAMISAIRNFDPSLNIKFTTYVVRPIIWEINQLLYNNSRLVKLSRSAIELVKKIKEVEEMFDYIPSEQEIANQLGITKERVQEVIRFTKELEHFEGTNLELSDTTTFDEDEILNKIFLDDLIKNSHLTDFEMQVIHQIKIGKNNSQIAETLGVYPMTINRCINRIRNKILNSKKFDKKCSKYDEEIKVVAEELLELKRLLTVDEIRELLDVCGFKLKNASIRILYYIRQKAIQEINFDFMCEGGSCEYGGDRSF